MVEIELDQSVCCGGRQCVAAAPEAFEFTSAGVAVVRDNAAEVDINRLLRAVRNCPVMAITIRRDGEVLRG